jgi:threonine dehydrogenase-like Zn-dependent dehydrogenase
LGAVGLGPAFGARVVGLGNSPVRLEMAERMGAHAAYMSDDPDLEAKLDDFTNGVGIDLVILTANPWPAYRTSLQVVRPNGRVSIVSLLGRGEPPLDFNPLTMELFYAKGISIIAVSGAAGYLYPTPENRFASDRSGDHILSLMADGLLEPKRLITHRFHYTEMVKAYEMAYNRDKSMLGVIFDWRN